MEVIDSKCAGLDVHQKTAMAILEVLRKKQTVRNNLTVEERKFMYILEQTERLVKEGGLLTKEHAHLQANAAMNFMTTTAWMESMSERR